MPTTHATVVFDNAKQTSGGTRSLDSDGRQLAFRHDGFQVELLLERSRSGAVVWGRLLRTDTGLPCDGARVTRLETRKSGSAETLTDVWGEFWLPSAEEPTLELQIAVGSGGFVCALSGVAA